MSEHKEPSCPIPVGYRRYVEGEIARLHDELARLRAALTELVDAGEPFIGEAPARVASAGDALRLYSRWQAAMNDARKAQKEGP